MRRLLVPLASIIGSLNFAGVSLATTAVDVCPATADPCVVATARSVTPGSTLDFGTRALDVRGSGSLVVSGGAMKILAGSVHIESHGALIGVEAGGTASSVVVTTTGDIHIDTGGSGDGRIDVSDNATPGEIDLTAGGAIAIAGTVQADGTGTQASGGVVNVTATGTIAVSGPITAKAGTLGLGGAITIAGGSVTQSGLVRVDGGDGGDVEIDASSGDITCGADVNASAGGTYGDGGSVALTASQNLIVNGNLLVGAAGSDIEGGGTGGDVSLEGTAGKVSLVGDIDNHGAAPDGDGGEVDVTAGTDWLQTGGIDGAGNGADGCGGDFDATAGGLLNFTDTIDESGGFCGGTIFADGGNAVVTAAGELAADGNLAGLIDVTGHQITVSGKVHAVGTGTDPAGGLVQFTGCDVSVPAGASLKSDGPTGQNLLQASGQMTIGGQLSSRPNGDNRLEYRDPTKPPVVLGTASILPARDCAPGPGCLNPTLPTCTAAAVCGNGILEPGEQCDDHNTAACDGCSPTCRVEACGNGVTECGEECDDGPANGGPGDPCDATCHVEQAAHVVFIPSGHKGHNACMLEWAIENVAAPGFPPPVQSCIDGDPRCDADGRTDGACTFHVSACLNVTDPRIATCQASAVASVKLRRPSPEKPADAVEASNAVAVAGAFEALGITVKSGRTILRSGTPAGQADHCTATFVQRIPHAPGAVGRRLLSANTTNVNGARVSSRVTLSCAPNPAVCGNGVVEIGEECDDGNTSSCDGCSSTCQRERCGDAVVACGEQCDDGAANGTPGDRCTATCTEAPPPNRIPGGGNAVDCATEWALASSGLATARNGIPSPKQTCADGDPSCDFDPTPGRCRFHLWTCLGGDDARVRCGGDPVARFVVQRPTAADTGPGAAVRQALVTAVAKLALPTGPGETCSGRIDVDVPAGRSKLVLRTEATTVDGLRDRDALKLTCVPSGTALRRR